MSEVVVHPATADRWDDVRAVLDQRTGGVRGCWCMYYRVPAGTWRASTAADNRAALHELVGSGAAPGLLAYRGAEPVGWVSVAPREQYLRLERSRIARPVDALPAWALACLYVLPDHRGTGVARALVRGAVAYAREHGAALVEAYAIDDTLGPVSPDAAFHGVVSLLRSEGFEEVARRTPKRPLMRRATGA